jgi:hypothetical protein
MKPGTRVGEPENPSGLRGTVRARVSRIGDGRLGKAAARAAERKPDASQCCRTPPPLIGDGDLDDGDHRHLNCRGRNPFAREESMHA